MIMAQPDERGRDNADSSRGTVFSRVVDRLGIDICSGSLGTGTVLTSDDMEVLTGASRSVIRESTRVLSHLGLLRPKQRVGMTVLPKEEWNLFDPQVIRWRLDSCERKAQIQELLELRLSIEPEAARLAAERASNRQSGEVVAAAATLWARSEDADRKRFAEDDAQFHRLILLASGNTMFAKLATVIEEALRERALVQLEEEDVDLVAMQMHVDLAGHIQRGEGAQARRCAREIILRGDPGEVCLS